MAKKKMNPKTQAIFLEGLRRYRERGVRILLDGKEVEIEDLRIIFEEQADGSFYMGDYILEEDQSRTEPSQISPKVQEKQVKYAKEKQEKRRKELKEIRFDRVYNR